MTSCVRVYIHTHNASTPFREWESEHTCVLQSARVPVCFAWRMCPHLCSLVQRTSASEAGFSGWRAGSQRRATSRTASHGFRNRVKWVACGFTTARHLPHRLPTASVTGLSGWRAGSQRRTTSRTASRVQVEASRTKILSQSHLGSCSMAL